MIRLNPALRDFWECPRPYKILKGGRVSSKTEDTAGRCIYLAQHYKLKFLCLRQFQNKIADSVYPVLKKKIYSEGAESAFSFTKSTIICKTTGTEFIFNGLSRNTEDIKGIDGVDICWIEEGEGLTEEQWEIVDPTIRKSNSEIWIVYNPRLQSDFIESKLPRLLGDDAIIRHINYDENPFISDTSIQKIHRLKDLDVEAYEHIYLGKARSDDDAVIIKRSWIDAAIDAHLKIDADMTGDKCLGYDVADSGSDNCATVLFDGSIALECEEWAASEDQLLESSTRVYHQAKANQASIIYDSIGVGAGTGSHINQLNERNYTNIEFSGFNAGAKVIDPDDIYLGEGSNAILNKDFFENAKAQAWWSLSVRFRNTYNAVHKGLKFDPHQLISISSDITNLQQLKDELSTPRKDYSESGKVMVESKKKLAKRNIKSPNLADAFVMALAPKESESLDFLSSNVNFFN